MADSNWKYVGARVDKEVAETFETRVGKNRVSLVLREMLKMFNNGQIVVELKETIGGAP